ncbi:MAG: diaminopimelate decarboxylase [Zoogloeaceae bacterium]|jgi:diaminopimelate decarboxylase|nr:diaminopimelate decarboxylase [Zoogloeaceae bacterium]
MSLPGSPFFTYRNGVLCVEEIPLSVLAKRFGTPLYVYSHAAISAAFREFQQTLAAHPAGANSLVCYAVKANSSLAILNFFAREGAGFDVVSGGELARVLAAGGQAQKIVFSGVGKTEAEMESALIAGILCFNLESAEELRRLNAVAERLGKIAPVSLRVNPDVDPKTHPYIATGLKTAKFGVPMQDVLPLYRLARGLPHLAVIGIDAHIGSQILETAPFDEALARLLALCAELAADGIPVRHIDLGGGFGIPYRANENAPTIREYLTPLLDRLAKEQAKGCAPRFLIVEPGRSLVGNAGALLTRVEYRKPGAEHDFLIVDAAMNDLMRPALYEAWHEIIPAREETTAEREASAKTRLCDVVGPVCESGDFLGKGRRLAAESGDLLAVLSAGAYGMAMSSHYNTRARAAEVLVSGSAAHLVRRREKVEDLWAEEEIPLF